MICLARHNQQYLGLAAALLHQRGEILKAAKEYPTPIYFLDQSTALNIVWHSLTFYISFTSGMLQWSILIYMQFRECSFIYCINFLPLL